MGMPGPVPVRFSRNMTVLREDGRLILVNTVRLDDEGLRKLDALGKVTDVLRLAGFHGMDDPFYADRYGAKVWTIAGQTYTAGFDHNATPYFEAHAKMDASTQLPLRGAKLYVLDSTPPEALLVLERHGGVVIAGDMLQNWAKADAYFSFFAKLMMPVMGFMKPCNVGPAWFKNAKPPLAQVRGVLDLEFEHVLPSHGAPVIGNGKARYRPRIEALTRS